MSKYVKKLISDGIKKRLDNVHYLMLVGLSGVNANANKNLRAALADKGIELMVIKNSMARRATEGTDLSAAFGKMNGAYALCWGAQDVVALAKELVKLSKDKTYAGLEIKGAVLDGEALNPAQAVEVSKWPTREEQISLLIGQIVGVGSTLSGQLIAMGGALASQIAKLGEDKDAEQTEEAPAAAE